MKYFWPLTVSKTFIYEIDNGKVIRSLQIKDVSKRDSRINVQVEENFTGYDLPISFKEEYQIDLGQDIILRNGNTSMMTGQKIYFKGPIKVGTTWDTKIIEIKTTISNEKKVSERVTKEGRCRINNFYDEFFLGKKRACIEVNCYETKTNTNLTKSYFCEDLGYVGKKSVISGDWVERLKKIE